MVSQKKKKKRKVKNNPYRDNHYLIIGLGNPGKEYEGTRHNVGFHTLDVLLNELVAPSVADGFTMQKSCNALVSKTTLQTVCSAENQSEDCSFILAKPLSYMNLSGRVVSALLRWYNVSPSQCIVITDNVDLDVGVLRAKKNGSGGTHNGIRSIQQHLSSVENGLEYTRVYVGVGCQRANQNLADFVLGRWHKSEQVLYEDAFLSASTAIIRACKQYTMSHHHDTKSTQSLQEIISQQIASMR